MNPKVQFLPVTNHGLDTVGRDVDLTSNTQITSNDAGPAQTVATDVCTNALPQPVLPPSGAKTTQPGAAVPHGSVLHLQRCEAARSAGYDPTGEHAVPCGALAQVVCEYCGPMCSACAEETFCYYGEHKLGPLEPEEVRPVKTRRRTREVVYIEIKCPNCRRVRLALPKKHRAKAIRKCPICKTKAPAEYLAHGITRRRLPYHEVFSAEKEIPEGLEFKRRIPWDRRPAWWAEED
jgi:hypothetical protein